jgi:signal transduction histidine kinase
MSSDRLRLRDIRNLSTFRLTLWFGLLFALGVVALLGTVYFLTARELSARSDRVLRLETARLVATPPADLRAVLRSQMENSMSRLNYYTLLDTDGRLIGGNMSAPAGLPLNIPQDLESNAQNPRSMRVLAVRTPQSQTLVVGRDITQIIDLRHHILVILVCSGLAIAALVSIGAWVLSLGPMRRVRTLERAGTDIARGNLKVRMPILGRGDELDRFASVVNVMVEEVARMLAQVKDVTDIIAHDLRSPLARVRNKLVRARLAVQGDEALEAVFASALLDINAVLERFEALLRIAELEASHLHSGFGPVEIDSLLGEAADLYLPFAEDRHIALKTAIEPHLQVDGDQGLLFEAISNLLDNAIKFTPEGGEVTLGAHADAQGITIEVRDNGAGIPPAEREKVLRRFHRGNNAAGVPGSGIGLSAVQAIVHLHGFALDLADGRPGLAVRIRCRT